MAFQFGGGGGYGGIRLGDPKPRFDTPPAGYTFDPVTGSYVQSYQSAPSKNALYDKLSNLALTGLNTMSSSGGAGGGAETGGGIPGLDVPHVTMPQSTAPDVATAAAQDLQFGSAKAKAGSMGRASLDALRANLAERGILGGGTEARDLTDRLAAATNPLSDLNVAQAQSNVETGNRRASEAYQGGIAQRGQDLSAAQQKRALDVQMAQQKSQQQQQYLQQVLSSLTKLLY